LWLFNDFNLFYLFMYLLWDRMALTDLMDGRGWCADLDRELDQVFETLTGLWRGSSCSNHHLLLGSFQLSLTPTIDARRYTQHRAGAKVRGAEAER
jgi:hypothetical protein